ncbi:PIN-like domain-containing protein [Photobacterium atrarenae]|uniref:PIN domain-containing protein n=1 Tax=Photobacterium atrarenae TaxID=865757 RepID=A0ABY5GNY7_9GAMM|nr:PIN-like domain-containing protein [Photobacterium atrarenae]UTV30876.1 PIN domain-containing protein [Photobacterium atrarenae]
MKNLFSEHFKNSDEDLNSVWDNCLFILDANILLDFYRYSDSTRTELFNLLNKIRERIWIPHRAAEEFFKNRLTVISEQEKSYDNTTKKINDLKKTLENSRQHPFVSKDISEKANSFFDELCSELYENKKNHIIRITNDDIKDKIADLFDGCVGKPYSDEELRKIISDGKEIYDNKSPHSYKDAGKFGDSEELKVQCRQFSDLIVWMQITNKVVSEDKGVVFISDDRKEDWWQIFNGKTIGARTELVKEFQDKTKHKFQMYKLERFLQLATEALHEKISEDVINEVRDVTSESEELHRRLIEIDNSDKHESLDHLIKYNSTPEYLRELSDLNNSVVPDHIKGSSHLIDSELMRKIKDMTSHLNLSTLGYIQDTYGHINPRTIALYQKSINNLKHNKHFSLDDTNNKKS